MLLKSRDIHLRFLRKTDAARLFAAIEESRDELEKYLTGPTSLHPMPDVEGEIERVKVLRKKRRMYAFGIFTAKGKQLLGQVTMHSVTEENLSGEVGCWVRTSQAGRGIATGAMALVLLFGFKELKLHKIVLRAGVDNPASWRIAEKLGFVFEGIQRHEQLMARGWVDLRCYSMLEAEFRRLEPLLTKFAKGKKD